MRLLRLLRRFRKRRPRPAILMYHRVVKQANDPWHLAVSPANFEEQISYIKKHRTPMLVDEMVRRLAEGTLPANAIAVTFDDGYRDNLVHAEPILSRYGVPGTIFLATGFVGRDHPYWWDELATMVLEAKEPARMSVETGSPHDVSIAWGTMEENDLSPTWRGWDEPQTERQKSYLALWRRLRLLSEMERSVIMDRLRLQFHPTADSIDLPMSDEEVWKLLGGGAITLGAHTVTHPVLTQIEPEQCGTEVLESVRGCSAYLGKPVSGFAYPFGEVNGGVRDITAASGLTWACSTESRFLDEGPVDLFRLPRVGVYDAPLPVFINLVTS